MLRLLASLPNLGRLCTRKTKPNFEVSQLYLSGQDHVLKFFPASSFRPGYVCCRLFAANFCSHNAGTRYFCSQPEEIVNIRTELLSEKYASQFMKVIRILNERKAFSREIVESQALTYYNDLGLHEYYFQTAAPQIIANNLECVIAARILKDAASDTELFPLLHQEAEGEVFFLARASLRNRQASQNYAVEKQLEKQYFGLDGLSKPWRLQCYRSVGSIFDDPENYMERLRTYFLQKPEFPIPPEEVSAAETDLSKIMDVYFYANKRRTATEEIYHNLNQQVVGDDTGRRLFIHSRPNFSGGYRIDFGFHRGVHTKDFFSRMGDCITMWGCYSQRKYVEPLSNGVSLVTAFIEQLPKQELRDSDFSLDQRVHRLLKSIQMQYIMPLTHFTNLAHKRQLTIIETAYCTAACKFIQHFSSTVGPAFSSIEKLLKTYTGPTQFSQRELYEVRTRLKASPFSEDMIARAVEENPDIVKRLYKEFQEMHHPRPYKERGNVFSVWEEHCPLSTDILSLDSPDASRVFLMFRVFNKSIVRTNFWKDDKLCLAFRLDPNHFLPASDFPLLPYAVMFFVALDFVGFHVRFSDVARGGIRVVRSFTNQMYEINREASFDEVYKLASTQHYKNKDLPEGGSKGVILLNKTDTMKEAEQLTQAAFMTYIDGMLDLLLEDPRILDRLAHSEVCFLGPDENTGRGELMDWAAEHARRRNAWFWKAFTTGKLPSMGGIPHDIYGMTTASVECYIRGILKKKQQNEEEVTRFLIGGPDGDLGSNALLKSRTKTTTIVDGSGVLHDRNGLNSEELHRLAEKRFRGESTSAMDYNEALLSPQGFKVSQDVRNTKLPDGSEIISGFQFRNEFHLSPMGSADLFNPCGGRPASVTPFNVKNMLDKDGKPRFRYIVEGANVFITDDARRILEHAGCILFKDASTNKGGVTSSSFEVLAALAMEDVQFKENMQVLDQNNFPTFYQNYVKQIVERIEENALLEFECLWNEGERTQRPRCDLSDVLSSKIIQLKEDILQSTSLWVQEDLVKDVLHAAIPNILMPGLISFETFKNRIPESYLKSIFASFLASRFYYGCEFTEDLSAFAFLDYINSFSTKNLFTKKEIPTIILKAKKKKYNVFERILY